MKKGPKLTPLGYKKVERVFLPLSHHHEAKRDYQESSQTCQMKLPTASTSDGDLGEMVLQSSGDVDKR